VQRRRRQSGFVDALATKMIIKNIKKIYDYTLYLSSSQLSPLPLPPHRIYRIRYRDRRAVFGSAQTHKNAESQKPSISVTQSDEISADQAKPKVNAFSFLAANH
jgi:hypothetical protein